MVASSSFPESFNSQHQIRSFAGGKWPAEVADLRKATFFEEKKFLDEGSLFDANDQKGTHIAVYDGDGKLCGATHIMLAEDSGFAGHTGIPSKYLTSAAYSSRTAVANDARFRGIFPLLMYAAMGWARLNGRSLAVGFMEEGEPPIKKLLGCEPIPGAPKRAVQGADGRAYFVLPSHGFISQLTCRAFEAMPRGLKHLVRHTLMPAELVETARAEIFEFYKNPWSEKVYAGSLTLNEYGRAIANLHQYVRWTTRLLAQITGQTDDPELRAHFIDHLGGEIDHERMLEADLRGLGWDVDWVMNRMAPDPDILNFMSVQQSLVSFERDPVLFLMVPLVAEGLSGFLNQEFIDALDRCMHSWGIQNPRSVTKFLRSHIHTDGGDDGHWAAVEKAIAGRIRDEAHHQRALSVIHAVSQSMKRAYANYVAVPDLGHAVMAGGMDEIGAGGVDKIGEWALPVTGAVEPGHLSDMR